MEPGGANEPAAETKPLPGGCVEATDAAAAAALQPQPPGKLKKTAFKLFSGRRSICSLPSFFGGRSKSHGKAESKKGITKSQTHDCLSWDVPAGDFQYHNQKGSTGKTLSNSVSSQLVSDPRERQQFAKGELSHLAALESAHHKLSLDKSSSSSHPKKGLRGLFSSIRRHKKSKNAEAGKSEAFEMSAHFPKAPRPVSQSSTDLRHGGVAELHVSASVQPKEHFTLTHECAADAAKPENTCAQADQPGLKSAKFQPSSHTGHADADAPVRNLEELGADPDRGGLHDLNPDGKESDQPSVHSSDQISLFGDVSSLKSFDSLTGCGDIIADQDEDGVAESGVSGERSRGTGKRASCYVTYQGGGEEMATPHQGDGDYLQGLWGGEAAPDVRYAPGQLDGNPEERPDTSAAPSPRSDAAGTAFTPQSDLQESVPNSDEGYYDSTTPGPEEDGGDCDGDGVGGTGCERLPRDSYSGDALYELFQPDDSLMSPPLGGESLETQKSGPGGLEILGMALQSSDGKVHSGFALKTGLIETEAARLEKIQQELLCWELQEAQKPVPEQVALAKSMYPDSSPSQCIAKSNRKQKGCLKEEPCPHSRGKSESDGSHGLKESSKNDVTPGGCNRASGQSRTPVMAAHVDCSERVLLASHQVPEQGRRRPPLSQNGGHGQSSDAEPDQTVCFSQALVDFTKHSRLFNNLSEGLEGSESGPPFSLPAMVTFDVVDMENEGECNQQMDMTADEEVQVYDETYLRKDSLAECEDRLFNFYNQSLFFSNAWGVASLPRHHSLTRVNQSTPVPLSSNRRSRSLDTDSLDFHTSDVCLAQPRALRSPIPIPRTERGSKRASSLRRGRSRNAASAESRDNACVAAAPWQPEAAGMADGMGTAGGQKANQTPTQPGSWKSSACGQASRPVHLPLQTEDPRRSDSFLPHPKVRPVGVTQGVPHFHPDGASLSKAAVLKEGGDLSRKSSRAADVSVPVSVPVSVGCNKGAT